MCSKITLKQKITMQEIYDFIYSITIGQGKIWLADDSLKIRLFDGKHLQETQKQFVHEHKMAIIEILERNKVYQPNYEQLILHLDFIDKLREDNYMLNGKLPLSFAQERLWFIEKYEQGTSVYNIPLFYVLRKQVNAEKLLHCLQTLIVRHEILHTVIAEDSDGNAYQKLLNLKEKPIHINHKTLPNLTDLDTQLAKDLQHIFDLTQDYSIKIGLYNVCDKQYLSIIIHHIMFDGWSVDILLRELEDLYLDKKLQSIELQYRDFALWQRQYLTAEHLANTHQEYWQTQLADYTTLNLLTDKLRPAQIDYAGDNLEFILNENLTKQLKTLAQELNISLYSVLLGGFALLLQVYSNQDDIILGTPVANRPYPQLENMLGFFVNMLPLRLQIAEYTNPNQNINSHNPNTNAHTNNHFALNKFLQYIANSVIQAQEHENLPFAKLIEMLKISQDMSKHPLFEVTFGLQNFGSDQNSSILELYNKESELYKVAKFALSLFLSETLNADNQEILIGSFNYATSLWHAETIQIYITTYINILQGFAERKNRIQYLNPTQEEQILHQWNATYQDYPHDKTIKELFEEQTLATPNNLALIYDDSDYNCDENVNSNRNYHRSDSIDKKSSQLTLTYAELNAKANQFAHYLQERFFALTTQAIQADTLIAVCLPRSLDLIIAILAIIKVGGAYVPLDPEYPSERKKYILQDTQTKLLITEHCITEHNIANDFANMEYVPEIVFMPNDWTNFQYVNTNLPTNITSTNLAYIIYTSGTTGKPKGVMIQHKSVVNHMFWMRSALQLTMQDNFLHKTPYVFDASVWELFMPLFIGSKLIIAKPDGHTNAEYLHNLIAKHNISIVQFVPSLWLNLLRNGLDPKVLPSLRLVCCGGEVLSLETDFGDSQNTFTLVNLYGPTECTIDACYYQVNSKSKTSVPIGKPISNTEVYVLNKNLQLLPPYAIGELYIGGDGLAQGYLNQPELTQEKFIHNPFKQANDNINHNTRQFLYKTGDLVYWNSQNDLEFMGRQDSQIKLHGHRIELGEIIYAMQQHSAIQQAIVVVSEKQYLLGYYVAEHALNPEEISQHLSQYLPQYMIPQVYVWLTEIPLTLNGKLNYRALPQPDFMSNTFNSSEEQEQQTRQPTTEFEQNLCKIWQQHLALDVNSCVINLTSNFFRLGGNSILAMQVCHQVSKLINLNIPLITLFKHPRLQDFAKQLTAMLKTSEETNTTNIDIPRITNTESQIPLSFAQERLWFIEKYEQGTSVYNIPLFYVLRKQVNAEKLLHCLQMLIVRHEILHTVIAEDSDGNAYQKLLNLKEKPIHINHKTLPNLTDLDTQLAKDLQHIFDLTQDYPIKIGLYNVCDKQYLSIIIHHIMFDGWSVDILLRELEDLYLDKKLQSIELQYRDFALWQRQYLTVEHLANTHQEYWQTQLADYTTLNLLTDKLRPSQIDYAGDNLEFILDYKLTKQLKTLAQELNISLYSVLLGGFVLLLQVYSNQDDIILGTPVANRPYPQLENMLGFFVNMLPLRLQIAEYTNPNPNLNQNQNQNQNLNQNQNQNQNLNQNINSHNSHANPNTNAHTNNHFALNKFLQYIANSVIQAQEHENLPFAKLIEMLKIPQDMSKHPLFEVTFGLQNFGSDQNSSILELYNKESELYKVAKFALSLFLSETINADNQEILIGSFNYATSLWHAETIQTYITTYINILQGFAERKNRIQYLNPTQEEQILHQWNATYQDYPHDKIIKELFEEQTLATPNNLALIYDDSDYNCDENVNSNRNYHRNDTIDKKSSQLTLTYAELNAKANQFAHYLQERFLVLTTQAIQADTLIAVCLPRSLDLIIAILAIIKVGGAYVPLDPEYPSERKKYILQDTQTKLLITEHNITEHNIANDFANMEDVPEIVFMPNDWTNFQYVNTNLPTNITSTNLAYVNYTSGSTGKPKGVLIEHQAVVNLVIADDLIKVYANNVVGQFANYAFDAFTFELWGSLLNGAKLVLIQKDTLLSSDAFAFKIQQHKVDTAFFTTALFNFYVENASTSLYKMQKILFGGEAINTQLTQKFLAKKPESLKLIHVYGPTETTTFSHAYVLNATNDLDVVNLPFGKPLANKHSYVFDANLNHVPINAIGELYIGGNGLARGYLNQEEFTQTKFIMKQFDFAENYVERLYKTADLVKLLPNGNLEFIGRNDNQVKIRGHRIELGEIENILNQHSAIASCVVEVKIFSANVKKIVAYCVIKKTVTTQTQPTTSAISTTSITANELRNYMQKLLPQYLVPDFFMFIQKMPLTLNGKIAKNLLPMPDLNDFLEQEEHTKHANQNQDQNQTIYQPPRTELERHMNKIWSEVLNLHIEKFGIYHDFFHSGGDSITSARLVSKIRQNFNIAISVKDIFKYRTIANICENKFSHIEKMNGYEQNKVQNNQSNQDNSSNQKNIFNQEKSIIDTKSIPLLPIQNWFFMQNFPQQHHFNQSFLLDVPELDQDCLQKSINILLSWHDVFRLIFTQNILDEKVVYIQQYIAKPKPKPKEQLQEQELSNENFCLNYSLKTMNINDYQNDTNAIQHIYTSWQNDFNLEEGKLYAFGYVTGFANHRARIFCAFHHLICDAVSCRVILEQLKAIYYANLATYQKIIAKPYASDYRIWAKLVALYGKYSSIESSIERQYWQNVLTDIDDLSNVQQCTNENMLITEKIQFDITTTQNLLTCGKYVLNTKILDLLLVALAYALHDLTGQKRNYITLEGHGREEDVLRDFIIKHSVMNNPNDLHIFDTIGWFTTLYPVCLEVMQNLEYSLVFNKENLQQIPNHGFGFGALFGYDNQQLPKISFNYLGQFNSLNLQIINQNKSTAKNHNARTVDELQEWYMSNEISGESVHTSNHMHYLLNINGYILDHKLQFNFQSKFSQHITQKFVTVFSTVLHNIMNYGLDMQKTYAKIFSNFSCQFPQLNIVRTFSDLPYLEPYERFGNDENKTTLFMFPPGDGGAESYLNNLVPILQKQYNLIVFNNYYHYVLDNYGNDYVNDMNLSYEWLANMYIAYMRNLQTGKKYHLFGWSFGGVLAFEVARQLSQQGFCVEKLVMLDAYFNIKKCLKTIDCHNVKLKKTINYNYLPCDVSIASLKKIILLKAKQYTQNNIANAVSESENKSTNKSKNEGKNNIQEIEDGLLMQKYYVLQTKYNHLDDFIPREVIELIEFDATHDSWVLNCSKIIPKIW